MKLCNFIDLRHCVIFVSRGDKPCLCLKKALCLFLFGGFPVPAFAGNGIGGGWGCLLYERKLPAGGYVGRRGGGRDRVLGEDTSLREEFTKQYTLEKRGKMAVVYPSAVHYEENGAWQDIDNRLNETTASYTVAAHVGVLTGAVVSEEQGGGITDAAGTASVDAALEYSETLDITEPALRNAAGALSVTFPTSLTDTNRIAVTHRGYTLYFRPTARRRRPRCRPHRKRPRARMLA